MIRLDLQIILVARDGEEPRYPSDWHILLLHYGRSMTQVQCIQAVAPEAFQNVNGKARRLGNGRSNT